MGANPNGAGPRWGAGPGAYVGLLPSAPRWAIAWASVYSVPVDAGWNAFM